LRRDGPTVWAPVTVATVTGGDPRRRVPAHCKLGWTRGDPARPGRVTRPSPTRRCDSEMRLGRATRHGGDAGRQLASSPPPPPAAVPTGAGPAAQPAGTAGPPCLALAAGRGPGPPSPRPPRHSPAAAAHSVAA
jgi:hypothetical protein